MFQEHHNPLWRGRLLPLGREAAPNLLTRCIRQIELLMLGLLRSQREQAPSPQGVLCLQVQIVKEMTIAITVASNAAQLNTNRRHNRGA